MSFKKRIRIGRSAKPTEADSSSIHVSSNLVAASLQSVIYPLSMSIETILAEIDAEIERLNQVRSLLAGSRALSTPGVRGKTSKGPGKPKKKRVLSADARKRIADAQRKRWAAQKAKSK
jgi:hypothetical protein